MKLAFSTLACPAWSLDQVVEAAIEYGYQGVELRLIDGELIDAAMPAAERRRVRRTFEQAGLPIVALDTSVRIAAAPDARSALDELVPMLELASEWESPVVRVFGGEWDAGRSREEAIGQARDVIDEAAATAVQLGVAITLETHDRFSNVDLVAEVLEDLPAAAAAPRPRLRCGMSGILIASATRPHTLYKHCRAASPTFTSKTAGAIPLTTTGS